jgi:LysM repeat protein
MRPAVKRRKVQKNSAMRKLEGVMITIAAAGLIWLGVSSVVDNVGAMFTPAQTATTQLTVMPGDTLWRIAGRLNGGDISQNDAVNEIRGLNPDLQKNPELSPGQTILVPADIQQNGSDVIHLAKAGDTVETSM